MRRRAKASVFTTDLQCKKLLLDSRAQTREVGKVDPENVESGRTFLRRERATTNFLVENLASRRFLAGWGGRAREAKTPHQLARCGAAPAALDVVKNIPTDAERTRPAFFPRKNASGQGKDAKPAAGGRRMDPARAPPPATTTSFPKNA